MFPKRFRKGKKTGESEEDKDIEEALKEEEVDEGAEKDVLEKDLEEGGEEEVDEKDLEEEEEGKKPFKSAVLDIVKDIVIAFIIVMIIIGGIYIYTGNWPPVVVVESPSMVHNTEESYLGVIDTGDLVLVKKIEGRNDVIPYMEGKRIGHETYSEYGDVLIYRKNGYDDITPVIHRAIVWLEFNETANNSFDIPELKYHKDPDEWYVVNHEGEERWYNLTGTVVLKNIGYDHENVAFNLTIIYNNFGNRGVEPHGGFITLGDNNRGGYDQAMLRDQHNRTGMYLGPGNQGMTVDPVKPQWVIGKARGELPWFGLIKLWFDDNDIKAPSNSWTMLFVSIVLIFAVPICIDITLVLLERRKARKEEEAEGEEEKGEGKEEEAEEEADRVKGEEGGEGGKEGEAPVEELEEKIEAIEEPVKEIEE